MINVLDRVVAELYWNSEEKNPFGCGSSALGS
jgi:hypothetical protein